MSSKGLQLTARDYAVFQLVHRFRFCLGRHIKKLAFFESDRTTDRRLKKLVDADLLSRKKYIYGVPYLYTTTHKSRMLINANKRADNIRIERINHDITVLDCVCAFVSRYGLHLEEIITEKEMHARDGFGNRRHYPDFIIQKGGQKTAVEIELTLKAKERTFKNGKDNFLICDKQIWITNQSSRKINEVLRELQSQYPNIEILYLEDVVNDVF